MTVNDKMQKNYRYRLTEPQGKNFDSRFKPELTPKQMLKLGARRCYTGLMIAERFK